MDTPDRTDPRGLTDSGLIAAMAAGEGEALAELYDRYAPLAYSVAMRILEDRGRAEDVLQDVFLQIWMRAASFDSERGSVRTWVCAAVRNRAIDLLRGRAGRARDEAQLSESVAAHGYGSDPERESELAFDRRLVRAALASLPAEQREAVELAYYGGLTQREVAERTGVPLTTVKGRMRLALEKVDSYLKSREPSHD